LAIELFVAGRIGDHIHEPGIVSLLKKGSGGDLKGDQTN
jgi:hypothetical protein